MKKCSKCLIEKDESEFTKCSNTTDGLYTKCRDCKKIVQNKYLEKNSEIINKKRRDKNNIIKCNNIDKRISLLMTKYIGIKFGSYEVTKYLGRFPSGDDKYDRYYFEKECRFCGSKSKNTPSMIESQIKTLPICNLCNESVNIHTIEKKCACCHTWLPANTENFPSSVNRTFGIHYYCRKCHLNRNQNFRSDIINRQKEYVQKKKRYKNDYFYKLKCNLRSRVKMALKSRGWKKTGNTTKLLGADFETVMNHIESQFKDNMTWENHSFFGWHIDHIISLNTAKNEDELYKLFHYKNLQPLWWYENLSKG